MYRQKGIGSAKGGSFTFIMLSQYISIDSTNKFNLQENFAMSDMANELPYSTKMSSEKKH